MSNLHLSSIVWPVGTSVQLLNVPWDAQYKDIVGWKSQQARDDWFSAQKAYSYSTNNYSYLKPGAPIRVSLPYSSVYKYNYVCVLNPAQPVDNEGLPKRYYYFIVGSRYLNPQTSEITLQLDVVTTYAFDFHIGSSYVESGHIAMANSAFNISSPSDLSPVNLQKYLTFTDGFDVGDRYLPGVKEFHSMQEPNAHGDTKPKIVLISTIDLATDPGTIDNPNLKTSKGQQADGLISGANVYSIPANQFENLMKAGSDFPWMTQGIICIYVFPGNILTDGPTVHLFGDRVTEAHFLGTTENFNNTSQEYLHSQNIFSALSQSIPDGFKDIYKLYTYPYSVIEISTYDGQAVYLKPEYMRDAYVSMYYISCALMPFARIAFFPKNYGIPSTGGYSEQWTEVVPPAIGDSFMVNVPPGDFMDNAIYIQDFPQFPIVNNQYVNYLAGSAHTRAYNYESAGWSNTKNQAAANLSYTQGNQAISNAAANQDISNLQTVVNGGMSTAGALLSGNVGGALMGAAGTAVNYLGENAKFQNNQNLSSQVNGQNYDMAKFVNQGDYQQELAAINAAVQDAALTPPSKSGQFGGEGFVWKAGLAGFTITFKTANEYAIRRAAVFYRRYGYQLHKFMRVGGIQDLCLMTHYTYWRLRETYLTCANANESEKDALRGVFETGVTVWNSPDEIGNIDMMQNYVSRYVDINV